MAFGLVDLFFRLAFLLIIIRVVLSWLPVNRWHPLVVLITRITEPFLAPFRRMLPPWRTGGLDLSPFFLILTLYVIRSFIFGSLLR